MLYGQCMAVLPMADEELEMCPLATCFQAVGQCSCSVQMISRCILLESTPTTGCRHKEVELAHRMPSGLANAESTNSKHACLFGKIAMDIMQVKLDLSAGCFESSGNYHALCRMFCMYSSCGQPNSVQATQGCFQQNSRHSTKMSIASGHSGYPMINLDVE